MNDVDDEKVSSLEQGLHRLEIDRHHHQRHVTLRIEEIDLSRISDMSPRTAHDPPPSSLYLFLRCSLWFSIYFYYHLSDVNSLFYSSLVSILWYAQQMALSTHCFCRFVLLSARFFFLFVSIVFAWCFMHTVASQSSWKNVLLPTDLL